MFITRIRLNNEEDVGNVCSLFTSISYDIDISCGKYLINGKSLLGLLMFLNKDLDVYGTCYPQECIELKNKLTKWEIE